MTFRTLLAVGLLVIWTQARADAPPPIDDAIKQAAATKKPLVIEFGAQWCGPCKEFAAKTLPDARVQAALKVVTFVQYDVDEDVGGRAAAKYRITSYPTFLIVDKQGVEVFRKSGAPLGESGIKMFVGWLFDARTSTADEDDIRAGMKATPNDPTVHLQAGHWFAARKKNDDAIAAYEKVSLNKQATEPQRLEATAAMVALRRRDQWMAHLRAEKIALVRALPAAARDEDLIIATVGSGLETATVRRLWQPVLAAEADVDKLNHLIYIALAAGAHEEALVAAKRLVEQRRNAQFLDTLAECHHMNHERDQALKIEDEAISMAKGSPLESDLRANRKRFDAGTGDVADIRQVRRQAETLWKRVVEADRLPKADEIEREPAPAAAAARDRQMLAMKQMRAEHDFAVKVAKACIKEAGDNEEAYARIELDDDGKIKKSVLMLEPTATATLRSCLTKQLTGAKVVDEPQRPRTKLMIDFSHLHQP